MRNVAISRQVQITMSAEDWELYDGPRADAAAAEINSVIEQAFNVDGKNRSQTMGAAFAAMKRFDELGALDSEPLRHLERLIKELFPP
jgi:hypothetical protein